MVGRSGLLFWILDGLLRLFSGVVKSNWFLFFLVGIDLLVKLGMFGLLLWF
jgi:hypothetical protein